MVLGGLADYLPREHASAVVDATHPFAATITKNAVLAASLTDTPLVRLERPGWREHPRASSWIWVTDAAAHEPRPNLPAAIPHHRPAVAARFSAWADRDVLVRLVDPPADSLPQRWYLIMSRDPTATAVSARS